MARPPKHDLDGVAHFITDVLYKRIPMFNFEPFCKFVINNFEFYRERDGFLLLGYVIMPDHVQSLIWPQGARPMNDTQRDLKKYIAREIIDFMKADPRFESRLERLRMPVPGKRKHKYHVWGASYHEVLVWSEEKVREKLRYMHSDPVRNGLVEHPGDWKYSSYRNYYHDDDSVIRVDRYWDVIQDLPEDGE